jgi:hypothetical protein
MSYVGDTYLGDGAQRRFTCAGHMTIAPTTPLAARLATRVTRLTIHSASRILTPRCPTARCPAVKHAGRA